MPPAPGEEHAGARIDRHRALGLQEDALVFDAVSLERRRARFAGRAAAPGLPQPVGASPMPFSAPARVQRRLPAENLVELLLVLLLVQQLATGDAIDLGAQLGDAILVAELHVRLPRDQSREHVLAKGEVGGGRDAPDRHDHQRADHDPERDRSERATAVRHARRIVRRPTSCRRAVRTAGMVALMIVVILRRRPSRHSRSPPVLRDLTLRRR